MTTARTDNLDEKGILFGVGVGPGSPDLLTLRAVSCIRQADVLCLPNSSKKRCRAYQTAVLAVPAIKDKPAFCFDFPMIRNTSELERVHTDIYQRIRDLLVEGKHLAFLTIGDPCVYSTFNYIAARAASEGFRIEIVNGVASFLAAAGSFTVPLCEKDEELHIGTGQGDVEKLLALPGTKVIMKCGRNMGRIKKLLQKAEREKGAKVYAVSDCGLETERRYYGADHLPEIEDYMTTILVL